MAITALPEDTVRLLGSHTVISTPVHLIKELLDNAIDAQAKSVEILVSPNVMDRIDVRDTGSGICPGDYLSLGRPGHTSKIKSFDDLRTVGGTTLGFRGQALASANNLGTVAITTRTTEDPIAMVLKLCPGVGGVESQQRSSAPVGTSVSVTGLYSRLPVRKQVAVKDASKNLDKIKKLLHAYALARPQIRLSFRIFGGDNTMSFAYVPRPNAGVKEAVVQILGTDLASQCLMGTICTTTNNANIETTAKDSKFCIQAILPRPDVDQACVSKGSFFSVDSRPVASQRETMKKLLATFKSYFTKSVEATYGEKSFRDPFICVNIRCPLGSYDPNIEPSKDVVLFYNESQVANLFERLCSDVYNSQGRRKPLVMIEERQLDQNSRLRTPPTSSDGPEIVADISPTAQIEIWQPAVPRPKPPRVRKTPLRSSPSLIRERRTRSDPQIRPVPAKVADNGLTINMSADLEMSSDEDSAREEKGSQLKDEKDVPGHVLNPWIIAKMNAPLQQTNDGQGTDQSSPISGEDFNNLPALRSLGEAPGNLEDPGEQRLGATHSMQLHQLPGFPHPLNPPAAADRHGEYLTDSGTNNDGRGAFQSPSQMDEAFNRHNLPDLRSHRDVRAEELEPDGLIQRRSEFRGPSRGFQNRQNVETLRHVDDIPWRSHLLFRKHKRVNGEKRHRGLSKPGRAINHVAEWVNNHRLTNHEVGSIRHPSTPWLSRSPQPSTEIAHAATMGEQITFTMTPYQVPCSSDTWVDGDSRKFLMGRQCSEVEDRRKGRPTLERIKTDRLPLGTIPDSQGLQGLVLIVESDTEKLAQGINDMVPDDKFCDGSHAQVNMSDEMGLDDVTEVEVKLKDLVSAWMEKTTGERTKVSIDLRAQVKGKGVAI